MSLYMPAYIVRNELIQQQKRREYGLKAGTHVKFPDKNEGPYIFKKTVLARYEAAGMLPLIKQVGEKVLEAQAAAAEQKPSMFKRLSKAARKMLR